MSMTPSDLRSEGRRDGINSMALVTTGRRGHLDIDARRGLPPAVGRADIDAAMVRLRELDAEARAVRATMNTLDGQTKAVAEQDRAALAAAIRTGEADPGDKESKAHAARLAEATRKAAALKVAVKQQAEVLWRLLEATSAELAAAAGAEWAAARKAEAEDLARLRASADAAELAKAKYKWASGLTKGRCLYNARTKSSAGLPGGPGGSFTVVALLDALEATLAAP